jgi:tripartite-type tricarboxylate transporter receptor subunit TctC
MHHLRRRRVVASSVALVAARAAEAQSRWPDRPVRVLVALSPGSATDIIARALAPALAETFGQPFLVENRTGAGGTLAAGALAAARDGHTLGVLTGGPTTTARALNASLPYDPELDILPVTQLARSAFVFVARPGVAASLPALIQAARSDAVNLSYGSIGVGSITHLAMEELKARHGVAITHVGYRGFPELILDMLAGRLHCALLTPFQAAAHVQAGRLAALAVTSSSRDPLLPNVPTAAEAGEPEAEFGGWMGVMAPAGFPHARAVILADALRAAVLRPGGVRDLPGWEPVGSSPDAFAAFHARETARWSAVVRRLGLTASD